MLLSLMIVSKEFNLPGDLSKLIYSFIINSSAQKIIDNWYSYVNIHHINLIYLINKLPVKETYLDISDSFHYYYNLNDPKVRATFNICFKYFNHKLSCKDWWNNIYDRACFGLLINNNRDNCDLIMAFEHYIISKFYYNDDDY